MSTTTLFLFLIGFTYGILTIAVGSIQLKQKKVRLWASILMIIGGLFTSGSIILKSILLHYVIYLLILGLLLIHTAAISNGLIMYGKINIKHHIIRLCISLSIIILFVY